MEEKKEREKEGEHEIEGGKEGGEIYSGDASCWLHTW